MSDKYPYLTEDDEFDCENGSSVDLMALVNDIRRELAKAQAEVERLRQEIVNASYQAITRLEIAREYYARIIELEGKLAGTQIERNDARSEVERLRGIIRDVLDNFDFGDKTTINYMVERLQEAK